MQETTSTETVAFLEAVRKLQQCCEAAELIYSAHDALSVHESDSGAGEDYGITVARRISTIMARLNRLTHPETQLAMTPRAILLDLMDIVRHGLFMALPDTMRHVGRERESLATSFNLYVSSRRVPVEAMLEGLHVLSYISAKLRVELIVAQLKRRLREELPHAQNDEGLAALMVTETLVDDFVEAYNNVLVTLPAVREMKASADTATQLVASLTRQYYHLGDWVLLAENATGASVISFTQVTRLTVDDRRGVAEVELHRPSVTSPWGILFNEKGRLVDVDVPMRVRDKAQALHHLLKYSDVGAVVTAVNDKPVVYNAHYQRHVLEAVQTASQNRKRIRLQFKSPQFKASVSQVPREVAFLEPKQGGEGCTGQRATLVLHRPGLSVPWAFSVEDDLYWKPPPTRLLSEAAAGFVKTYAKRVRVFAVNGVEVSSSAQARSLVKGVETVSLTLVVGPPNRFPSSAAPAGGVNQQRVEPTSKPLRASPTVAVRKAKEAKPAKVEPIEPEPLVPLSAPTDHLAHKEHFGSTPPSLVEDALSGLEKVTAKPSPTLDGLIDLSVEDVYATAEGDKHEAPAADEKVDSTAEDAVPSKDTAATVGVCVFDNHVKLLSLTDEEMVLQRPSKSQPWGIPIERSSHTSDAPKRLPLRLVDLPARGSGMTHPFVDQFEKSPETWFIASVNKRPAKNAEDMLRFMGGLTRMTLRFLRK